MLTETVRHLLAEARRVGATPDSLLARAEWWSAKAEAAPPGWPRRFARRFERANREAAAALAERR